MPPKGWRKNADGSYPLPNKDQELVSIDEILFPRSIVQRLSKAIIGEIEDGNVLMAKDSIIAIQRSATVFVSHIMFHAKNVAKSNDRKTVNAQDILTGLEKAGYSSFVSEVKQRLVGFEAGVEEKKRRKKEGSEQSTSVQNTTIQSTNTTIEEEDSDEGNDQDDDDEQPNEVEEIIVDDEEEGEEKVETNPIALISKDEQELEGSTIEEPQSEDEE